MKIAIEIFYFKKIAFIAKEKKQDRVLLFCFFRISLSVF